MAGLYFDSDVDQWNEEAVSARNRAPVAPKESMLQTVGKGLSRGFIKLNKGFAITAHGILNGVFNPLPGEEEEWQQTFEGYDKALKATTPDPNSTGTADKIIGAIAELPTQLVGGPYLMLNSVAMNTGADLVEQGVDPKTATVAAIGSAATTAAMMKIPQVGNNWMQTAGLLTVNPVLGAANDLALKTGLEARGYKEQAAAINPLDPSSRITDLALGGIFAALGYRGMRAEQKAHASALESAGAKVEQYNDLVKKIGGDAALRERLPVEVVDSLDTMDNYGSTLAKNPFDKAALDGVDRHLAMLNTALEHIQQGKPAEVAHLTEDLHQPPARTVEFQGFMDKWGARFGLTPEQQAAQEAIVIAFAKNRGISPDEFASRYLADVTNQHPQDGAYYQGAEKQPVQPFFSALSRSVDALKQERWDGNQLLNTLKKTPGIKPEEITWTGLDEYLSGKKSVTRGEVRAYLEENQVLVKEIANEGDNTRYGSYVTPGGENYRELLLTLPTKESAKVGRRAELAEIDRQRPLTPAEQAEFDSLRDHAKAGGTYRSSHFDEPNILAHVRFDERIGVDGERILHIEEVQSDWHQARRDGKPVPDAPFAKTWHELSLRRMLRWAAEENFDRVTWTTGEQQADRYDLSKKMSEVSYRTKDGQYDIAGTDVNGIHHQFGSFSEKQLPDALGKELARKIVDHGQPEGTFKGVELKAGGEGMKGFYDKILPDFLNKFGKKFEAKVSDVTTEDGTFHSIPVTDAMRDSLLYEGQPLFQDAKGAVTFLSDGRAVIHALQNPDVTTAMHELAHIFRRTLDKHDQNQFTRWLMGEVPGASWTRAHEEKFARAFETYLSEGKAPSAELQPFFDKFKNWFMEIYRNIIGSPLEMKLHPEVKKLFDAMLYREPLRKEVAPELAAVRQAVEPHATEVNADLHELAGLPHPDNHIPDAGKMVQQPPQQTPPRVMRDIAMQLYEDPDLIKRFTQEPTKVSGMLADLFEEQAGLLEKSTSEHFTTVNDSGESVRMNRQWSNAPEWFLAHNRHLKRNKKTDGIAKDSVVNALRKAANGQFDKLTAGQQDMVLSALDSINHTLQQHGRDYDAFELQVGDHYTAPDLGSRTVVAERDNKIVLDNGEMIDKNAVVRVLGEVDTTGRPPQAGYDPLDYQVQTLIKERGDFNIFAGTDSNGQPVWLPASEFVERAKNEATAHDNRKHLYDRAAACMAMEI